jgi:hypothetical protein
VTDIISTRSRFIEHEIQIIQRRRRIENQARLATRCRESAGWCDRHVRSPQDES